jgi:TatD DNase family protein
MHLVDFHCHLDLFPDPAAVIAEAEAARIYTLTVTTTPRAWPGNVALTRHATCVRPALGLHPQLAAEHGVELGLWERYLPEARYVGEVGLDAGPRHFRSLALQKQIFERVLKQCAACGGKILTVHSVRSAKLVLDMIEAWLPPSRGKVVLHWFTGSKAEARRALELGCYFSVNASMLAGDNGRALVAGIPSDRLLTETDGPFTLKDGRPTRPSDVRQLIQQLSNVRSASVEEMGDNVISNLRTLVESVGDAFATS